MSWDYAELAHTAKEFGGPNGLVAAIYEGGLIDGRIQGGVFVGLVIGSIGGIGYCVNRIVKRAKSKAAAAKELIVNELNFEIRENDEYLPSNDGSTDEGINADE